MAAAPIDYDALAQQHGGTAVVDYDALAAQHGGTVAAPPADTRSLFQKAKDNFNANTQGAQPGDGAVKGFIENVGAGGGDILRSIGHAVAHPIDTVKAAYTEEATEEAKPISEQLKDAVTSGAILGMGGKQVVGTLKGLATQPGRTIGQLGTGAIIGEGIGAATSKAIPLAVDTAGKVALLGKTPEGAYESAMKPSPAISAPDRAAIVQTGLQNEIPVSKAGVEKIGDLIDTLNSKIKDTIASDPTRPIDPNAVAIRADLAKAKFAKQVNATGDLNAIEASKQQFLQEQGAPTNNSGTVVGPAPDMGAQDAQEMKQGTYRVLAGKYGEQGSASVEAQKALARGLKEEIATQFPEISNLNQAESRLLDLQPVLERAVNRISNHQAIGIGTPIAGAAAEAVTGSMGAGRVAMVMKAVLDNPNVKSRLAIAVSKANKIPIATAMNRVNSYSATLGASAAASQANSTSGNSDQAPSPAPSQ